MRDPKTLLVYFRKSRLVTQVDLAIDTGIPQSIISEIERGKRDPSKDQAEKIAAAIGCPVSNLFREE